MHLLLVENRELKVQARRESARAEETQRELRAELGKVKDRLRSIKEELEVAQEKLRHNPAISRYVAGTVQSQGGRFISVSVA